MIALISAVADRSLSAFGALLFLLQLMAHEAGYWIGFRQTGRSGARAECASVVVSAILALFAFVLALTLSFASGRFNERRQGTVAEANALSTAWLRAEAVGLPRSDKIAHLLEQYTQTRLDFVQVGRNPDEIAKLSQQADALQSAIWGQVAAIVRENPGAVATWLSSSVNEAFDAGTAQRFGYELKFPRQIFWLLIGLSALSVGAIGYQFGLKAATIRPMVWLLMVVWTVVIIDILDLGAGRSGNFRTDTIAYEWALRGFKDSSRIPPAPGQL
jgi:hypothetical protein